jgi:phage anti-repressor protein
MSQMIQPTTINFKELVKNSNTTLSLNLQTKIVDKLNEIFDENEQHWYVANLYMYMNYHPTNDFPINLEDIFKMIGFANKGNAKRTLENNFTKDEDYKSSFLPTEKREIGGSLNEKIMLNIDTFKNLCMIAKTDQGKEIRKYYVKLENIYNEIIKEELEQQKLLLESEINEKDKKIKLLEHKPETHGFDMRKSGYVYLINDLSKSGHYKIGMANNSEKRLRNLNTSSSEKSLRLYFQIETYDIDSVERSIHYILQPYNIKGRREWFYFSDKYQIKYAMYVMNTVKSFYDNFNFFDYNDLIKHTKNKINEIKYNFKGLDNKKDEKQDDEKYKEILNTNNINNTESSNDTNEINTEQNNEINDNENSNEFEIKETNLFKLTGQRLRNKTGIYKGVYWVKEKNKWRGSLKVDYKEIFLGYFDTELDGAKAYNDYALYLNQTTNTNYLLNDIENYTTIPRNIPEENKKTIFNNKTSKYNGVSYDVKKDHYQAAIKYKGKSYHLMTNKDPLECAKIYNQQALYFNNTYGTKYILNDIPNYITVPKNIHENLQKEKKSKKSSKYIGVTFSKQVNKYKALIVYNKKQICLGSFENELDAAKAYNKRAIELNDLLNQNKYKTNTF